MINERSKLIVKDKLEKLGIHAAMIDLGMVEIERDLTMIQRKQLGASLLKSGLILLDIKKTCLIEKIRQVIIEMIYYTDELPDEDYSVHISKKLDYDYTYLSNLFSSEKGITIQQFIIIHKIERVKELLLFNQYSLAEIANKMQYSSISHLSGQFKEVTGFSPALYRQFRQKAIPSLDF